MAQYSKSFEREENRMMNKGVTRSILSVVLCWLPVVSLILAISGFIRVSARITKAHRVKKFFMTLLTLVILTAVLGAHIGAVYVYVRNPNIVDELAHKGWKAITGEDTLPWQAQQPAYDPYSMDDYNIDDETNYDGLDSDFDDRELAGFEEDVTGEELPADESVQGSDGETVGADTVGSAEDTTDNGLKNTSSLDLYHQMKSEKGIKNSTPVG